MHILIKADNSYEAVATKRTYATAIKEEQQIIKSFTSLLSARKKELPHLQKIAALKLQLQHATGEKQAKIKSQINTIRMGKGIGVRTTISGVNREIAKMEKRIESSKAKIEKLRKLDAEAKERAKNAPKPAPVKTHPRMKIDDSSIMPRLSQDKAKGQHVVTPKKARDKTSAPVSTTHTKALTAADKKHAKAVDVVKSKIVELKAAMEKTRSEPKKAQLKLEINKQRAALRELNKGQRAANQAAVSGPKSSKSPMGQAPKATTGAKTTAEQKTIARKTAQLKDMREKVREMKEKNGGKIGTGANRSFYNRYLNLRDELKALKGKASGSASPMGAAPKAAPSSGPKKVPKIAHFNLEVKDHLKAMHDTGMITKAKLAKAHKYIDENTSMIAGMNAAKAHEVADTVLHLTRPSRR